MKKPLSKNETEAPRQIMAVVVSTLTPPMCLYNTATGTLRRVIGGNVVENNAYLEPVPNDEYGVIAKERRMAAEEENYQDEYLPFPLPNLIAEVPLDEYPECQLVIPDCKVIEINPKPEPVTCKIIEHPAVKFANVEPKVSPKKRNSTNKPGPNQIYFYPPQEPNYNQVTQRLA